MRKPWARNRMRGLMGVALDVIEGAMANPDLSAKDRLQAAFKVLDMCGINELASADIGMRDAEDVEHERKMVAMGLSIRPR